MLFNDSNCDLLQIGIPNDWERYSYKALLTSNFMWFFYSFLHFFAKIVILLRLLTTTKRRQTPTLHPDLCHLLPECTLLTHILCMQCIKMWAHSTCIYVICSLFKACQRSLHYKLLVRKLNACIINSFCCICREMKAFWTRRLYI